MDVYSRQGKLLIGRINDSAIGSKPPNGIDAFIKDPVNIECWFQFMVRQLNILGFPQESVLANKFLQTWE